MKKYFEQPEIAVTKLDVEDIITTSSENDPTTSTTKPNQTALG